MASTELVGPLPRVWFRGGTAARGIEASWTDPGVAVVLTEPLPINTLDPRYDWCANHHTACVCREAEMAENLAEYRSMYKDAVDASREILAGHRTFPDTYQRKFVRWDGNRQVWEWEFDPAAVCSCTGCQIARKAYLR